MGHNFNQLQTETKKTKKNRNNICKKYDYMLIKTSR